MSVLLVLLMFALVMTLGRLLKRRAQPSTAGPVETLPRLRPRIETKFGTDVPTGYCFHPCHTWAVDEGWQLIRVGVDRFAVNLFGKIEHIDVVGLYRWVRQGQKLMTITVAGISVDLPSPVEGALTAVNRAALENPELVTTDPFCEGWIAVIKSHCYATDQKNLMQGAMVAPWISCLGTGWRSPAHRPFEPGFDRTTKQTGKRVFPDSAGRVRSAHEPACLMVVPLTMVEPITDEGWVRRGELDVLRDLTSDDPGWYGSAGHKRPAETVVPAPSGPDSPER